MKKKATEIRETKREDNGWKRGLKLHRWASEVPVSFSRINVLLQYLLHFFWPRRPNKIKWLLVQPWPGASSINFYGFVVTEDHLFWAHKACLGPRITARHPFRKNVMLYHRERPVQWRITVRNRKPGTHQDSNSKCGAQQPLPTENFGLFPR